MLVPGVIGETVVKVTGGVDAVRWNTVVEITLLIGFLTLIVYPCPAIPGGNYITIESVWVWTISKSRNFPLNLVSILQKWFGHLAGRPLPERETSPPYVEISNEEAAKLKRI